jgi:hypothetical protein
MAQTLLEAQGRMAQTYFETRSDSLTAAISKHGINTI